MFTSYSKIKTMRNCKLIKRFNLFSKRCCNCEKMVYFSSLRCKFCSYTLHPECENSDHCCIKEKENFDHSLDTIHSNFINKNSSQILKESKFESLDNSIIIPKNEETNKLTQMTENVLYEELPIKKNSITDINENKVNENKVNKNKRCSLNEGVKIYFDLDSKSKTTHNTPVKINYDNNNNVFKYYNKEENNIDYLKSLVKKWWSTRFLRRNSKNLLIQANLADKHGNSKYSLTTDDKLNEKQLESLLKKKKKNNKVRFNFGNNEKNRFFVNRNFNTYRNSKDLTAEEFLIQQQRLIEAQKHFGLIPNHPQTLAFIQTHVVPEKYLNDSQLFFKNNLISQFNNSILNYKNTDLKVEKNKNDILNVEHYYCPSKIGYQKKNIPKLFRKHQNVSNNFNKTINEKSDKLTLTKARTLSMEAKTEAFQSFFATWPNSSFQVSTIEDFIATEEEIRKSLGNNYDGSSNENVEEVIKEWSIPFEEIRLDTLLRQTRKGEIYKGDWYGDVNVYTFNKYPKTEEFIMEFKKEVAQFTKIRHENIMLFMGFCLDPYNLALITSMQRGCSLYECIHKKKKNLTFPAKINVLRQVAQAMGYLHARGIVHKRISSNNIILENKVKICLMDQGFDTLDYNSKNYAIAAKGHLTYLSPELIRSVCSKSTSYFVSTGYSKESDVYAFGTLLFELMSNRYPYQNIDTDQVIWNIGNGIHESVEQLKCDPTLKSIISQCWSPHVNKRPAFSYIVKTLQEKVFLHKRHSSSEPESLNKIGLNRLF